jgi:uncharacterized OB-fold protein
MSQDWLLPDVEDPDSAPFWEGTARGELSVQACAACGQRCMPPRPMCFRCRSLEVRWEVLSGRGRIWSFVIAHPPLLPAYEKFAPYNVVVVECEDDPTIRFVGGLVKGSASLIGDEDRERIAIGAPVRVVFTERAGVYLPNWILC